MNLQLGYLDTIVNFSVALTLGGIAGGAVSALVLGISWWIDARGRVLRGLLNDGLAVHALLEAWVLEGTGHQSAVLSENPAIGVEPQSDGLWLRAVEVRAVLDEARWNSPKEQFFYGFVGGRRVWIVRDKVESDLSYGAALVEPHAALMSSRGLWELCSWIESAASINRHLLLSKRARLALWPIIASVAGEDRIAILADRLTPQAKSFLRWYEHKYSRLRYRA